MKKLLLMAISVFLLASCNTESTEETETPATDSVQVAVDTVQASDSISVCPVK